MLPEGLEFLKLGWWVIHVLAVLLVGSYAYRRGRLDERKSQDAERAARSQDAKPTAPAPAGPVGERSSETRD